MSTKVITKKDPLTRLATLGAGSEAAPIATEKTEKTTPPKKNGGARPGAGRKPATEISPDAAQLRRGHLQYIREHANEKVLLEEITYTYEGKGKKKKKHIEYVEMTRLQATLEMMFRAIRQGESWAVREYLDRVLGKAAQPVVGDEDEPIVLRVDF